MKLKITRELLDAYIDDHLEPPAAAYVENSIRESKQVQDMLRKIQSERDLGEHSVGATWRRERLSCPDREELSSYLLKALDEDKLDYIRFHLEIIKCPTCIANLTDLLDMQKEGPKAEAMTLFIEKSARFLPSNPTESAPQ